MPCIRHSAYSRKKTEMISTSLDYSNNIHPCTIEMKGRGGAGGGGAGGGEAGRGGDGGRGI